MARIPSSLTVGATFALAAFWVGRWSVSPALAPAPELSHPPPPVAAVPGSALAPHAPGSAPLLPPTAADPSRVPPITRSRGTESGFLPGSPAAQVPAQTQAVSAAECPSRLQALEQQLGSEEQKRRETEGAPILKPPPGLPERLSQGALTAAMTLALQQSKVPGRLETIDCAEYPCILYGRIEGDEDNLERIERARAFAPYRADLMTLLSWTQTDQSFARRGANEERPERLLFAIALYTREDRTRFGDNLDRRIRVRTADLWNALRPDDEE